MDITWDPIKAESNFKKHGISFEEAATVIQSGMTVTIEDDSIDEQRFATIGVSIKLRVLLVVHTYRDESEVRIISARKATKKEQQVYEKRIRLQ
ncbi:MAG: BrnT family toxin [Deltaproteobacteria bacterium]|nr:BrnT family toxin [Deltaproteobacteria bacterium]MBI3293560.1 BrnT family toxin [Deltaproteobacteria bacterium]